MTLAALPFLAIYISLSSLLIWHDLKTRLLPDRLTCPLLWSGLLCSVCLRPDTLPSSVLGAIAGYSGFSALYWGYRAIRKKAGMGYGDIKFLAALGAWHGWEQLPSLVTIASGLALLFVCFQMVVDLTFESLKNPLPFGPFLAAAGFVTGWQTLLSLLP